MYRKILWRICIGFNKMFNSDGTVKVERYTLHKDGYQPMKLRKILGVWEFLAYKSHYGDEKWQELPIDEKSIILQIGLYGEKE